MAELFRGAEDYNVALAHAAGDDLRVHGGVAAARKHLLLDDACRRRGDVRDAELEHFAAVLKVGQGFHIAACLRHGLGKFDLIPKAYEMDRRHI